MITVLSVAFVDDAGICAIVILEAEGVLAHARQNVARLDLSTTQSMSAEVGWTSSAAPFRARKGGLVTFSRRASARDHALRVAGSPPAGPSHETELHVGPRRPVSP